MSDNDNDNDSDDSADQGAGPGRSGIDSILDHRPGGASGDSSSDDSADHDHEGAVSGSGSIPDALDLQPGALTGLPISEQCERLFNYEPRGWQAEALNSDSPDISINGGRQIGKTDFGGLVAAYYGLALRDETIAILARWQDTADEIFSRMRRRMRDTGLSYDQLGVDRPNRTEWHLDTDTRIIARPLPHDADQFRGKLPKVVVIDEAALVVDRVFSRVIEPMFITHGSDHLLIVMSTPRGDSGYHYRKHIEDPDFASFGAASTEWPLADQDYLAKIEAKTDSVTWDQEYLGKFVATGDAYIAESLIRDRVSKASNLGRDRDARRGPYLGVDIAGAGEDRTVYIACDSHGVIFHVESEEKSSTPLILERLHELQALYGFERILIDGNAIGGGVVDFASLDPGLNRALDPVKFNGGNIQSMYRTLKRTFEAGEILLPASESPDESDDNGLLISELAHLAFSHTKNGILQVEAMPGYHDDFSDAAALAVWAALGGEDYSRSWRRRIQRSPESYAVRMT